MEELHSFLLSNPEAQYFYDIFASYWLSKPDETSEVKDHLSEAHFNYILQSASADEATEYLIEEAPEPTAPIRIWFRTLAAPAIIIALAIGSYFYYGAQKQTGDNTLDNYRNEVVAKPGVRSKMLLPDGTIVWLNSQSKLAYPNSFNNNLREVHLEGEAFFEAAYIIFSHWPENNFKVNFNSTLKVKDITLMNGNKKVSWSQKGNTLDMILPYINYNNLPSINAWVLKIQY